MSSPGTELAYQRWLAAAAMSTAGFVDPVVLAQVMAADEAKRKADEPLD